MPSIENRDPNPQQTTTRSTEKPSVPIQSYIAEALALARYHAIFRCLASPPSDSPATNNEGPALKAARAGLVFRISKSYRGMDAISFAYTHWHIDYINRVMTDIDKLLNNCVTKGRGNKNHLAYVDNKLKIIFILFILNHCGLLTDRFFVEIKDKLIMPHRLLSFCVINKLFVYLDRCYIHRRKIVSLDLINSHGVGKKFIQFLPIFCRTVQQVSLKSYLNRIMNNKFFDACSHLGYGNSELFMSLINLIRRIDHGKGFLYEPASLVKLSSLYDTNVYFGEHVPNLLAFIASQYRNCNRSVSFRHLTMAADNASGTVNFCLGDVWQ